MSFGSKEPYISVTPGTKMLLDVLVSEKAICPTGSRSMVLVPAVKAAVVLIRMAFMNVDPMDVPYIKVAGERHFGSTDIEGAKTITVEA